MCADRDGRQVAWLCLGVLKGITTATTIKLYNLYLKLGLKLGWIHHAIKFKQSHWLQLYIDFNTNQCASATNDFEKNFYKLMNNAVFWKKTLKTWEKTDIKKKLKLNRPIQCGIVILDLAKLLMYHFYYDVLKAHCKDNMDLLFTDIDSLCIQVRTDDLTKDLESLLSHLDSSGYPTNDMLHCSDNRKIPGKFKDERNGNIIIEFVGLRSKMYSFITAEECIKTCKGIASSVNKHILQHYIYVDSLFEVINQYNIYTEL